MRRQLVHDEAEPVDAKLWPQRPGIGIELDRGALEKFETGACRHTPASLA